ncbi:MAG: hypothetical protein GVY19_14080 [Bacteroidetes bacterium]|nr:hypothetical protein [Bacteroidota bacterium]
MKKFYVFLFMLAVFQGMGLAQRSSGVYGWFFLSPKASFGTGFLTNQHVFSDNNVDPHFWAFSHTVGGQAGMSIMNFIELAYEYEIQSPTARYTIAHNNVTYTKKYDFLQQGHTVLLKVLGNINYVEVGWGMVQNQSLTISNSIVENSGVSDPEITDQPEIFEDEYNKFILGIGFTPYQSGLFEVEMGARLAYGLGSNTKTISPIADNFYAHNYSGLRDSRLLNVYFQVQLKYFFGFYGKAMCGSRGIMFFKKPKNFRLM